jgi:cell volume regulation protein A
VRGEEAVLPRGSTVIEAGDRLHVVVRSEVAAQMEELVTRWENGPVGPPPLERRPAFGGAVFSSRPWNPETDGDAGQPREIDGVVVREQLRMRRDRPAALVALVDGRYALTGETLAVGGPRQVQAYARRRLGREAGDAGRAWWQEVIGALSR